MDTTTYLSIRFDKCVEGGESQLVDMFQAMEILRNESPEDFRTLTRVPCTFSTIDGERKSPAYLITRKPIIQVDYDNQVNGTGTFVKMSYSEKIILLSRENKVFT